jgi:hypothetical protein
VEVQTNELKNASEKFNEVLNQVNALGLNIQIKTSNEFEALVKSPNEWIKQTLISGMEAQTVSVFGITLKTKPAKLLEMMELPDLNPLAEKCTACVSDLHLLRYFNITSKKINLASNAIDTIVNENSMFARTSQAIKASETLETLTKAINEYNSIAKENNVGSIDKFSISSAFYFSAGEASINEQFLKSCGLFN